MTPFEERDGQLIKLIRHEIETAKSRAKAAGWKPGEHAWHRAFGELSGMYRILQLIDRDAHNVL